MKLYEYKKIDLGFIVISSEPNIGRLKSTCNSIKSNYSNSPVLAVVPKDINKDIFNDMKNICDCYKGKDTITSLINTGFKNCSNVWNMIIMEGTWVKGSIDKKYSYFLEDEKDIFYPVLCNYDIMGKPTKIHSNPWDCSLNGMMIHKKTYEKIGDHDNECSIEVSRYLWSASAKDQNCKFKAILGVKIC